MKIYYQTNPNSHLLGNNDCSWLIQIGDLYYIWELALLFPPQIRGKESQIFCYQSKLLIQSKTYSSGVFSQWECLLWSGKSIFAYPKKQCLCSSWADMWTLPPILFPWFSLLWPQGSSGYSLIVLGMVSFMTLTLTLPSTWNAHPPNKQWLMRII